MSGIAPVVVAQRVFCVQFCETKLVPAWVVQWRGMPPLGGGRRGLAARPSEVCLLQPTQFPPMSRAAPTLLLADDDLLISHQVVSLKDPMSGQRMQVSWWAGRG